MSNLTEKDRIHIAKKLAILLNKVVGEPMQLGFISEKYPYYKDKPDWRIIQGWLDDIRSGNQGTLDILMVMEESNRIWEILRKD